VRDEDELKWFRLVSKGGLWY